MGKTALLNRIVLVQDAMDVTAAGTITGLIVIADGLDASTPGNEFLTKVKAARDGYEILTPSQKALVSPANLVKLETKEKSLVFSSVDFATTLLDNSVDYIVLADSFELDRYIGVTRAVKIDGNNKTLTLANQTALYDTTSNSAFVIKAAADAVSISNMTIDMTVSHDPAWLPGVPMYFGMQVTGTTGLVNLNNMTFKGGHVGLYVNGGNTTANTITTDGNTLAGIGIKTATFTTNGDNAHLNLPGGKPAIYNEAIDAFTLTGYSQSNQGSQTHYTKNN